jgi:putative FmdB family regulatory protein
MPTYEYACKPCEESLSEIRSIHEPSPVHTCEKCGLAMVQVIGSLGIQFKGSGFYSKDK